MKKLLPLLAAASLVFSAAAQAANAETPAAKAPTAQQTKMTDCNAEAKTKDLKGDERKAFMKQCLSHKPQAEAAQGTPQQEKMKTCNADAKKQSLAGDKRKAFMKECLAAKP